MTVATIRKAIGAAVVAVLTTLYTSLTADGFSFAAVTPLEWQAVAIAGLAAFTTVYHLPNALADAPTVATVKPAAPFEAMPAVVPQVTPAPVIVNVAQPAALVDSHIPAGDA